jgi:membrane-bound serine protease (ClpP class)
MTLILILSVVGIAAVLAELVLPGGILGVIGALCLVGAVIATYAAYGATAGTIALAILVVVGLIVLYLWMRLFHRLPFMKQLILNDAVGIDAGMQEKQGMTGRIGTVLTDLMPSGRGEFDGEKIDIVTEGPAIRRGARVEIVETRGPSIIVREIREGE